MEQRIVPTDQSSSVSENRVLILRCGNPTCGGRLEKSNPSGRNSTKRLCDVSFMCGVIKCPRCKCFNEVHVENGILLSMTTIDVEGKVVYSFPDKQ